MFGLNKLQQKSRIFEIIKPLKQACAIDERMINAVFWQLKQSGVDFEFASRILIKESDYANPNLSAAILYMAQNLAPDKFMDFIMDELNSHFVSDDKKMFLMNVLSGLGVKISPEEAGEYLENPDLAVNNETARFLEKAVSDPSAQVDFLDFYFSSTEREKRELLSCITEDFEGNNLASILSPLSLSVKDEDTILFCIQEMAKSNSPIALKPFYYLSHNTNPKISALASKMYRKFMLKGISKQSSILYDEILGHLKKPYVYITVPDGNSNFTMAISRENSKGAWFDLFIAMNTELGPFSCFGFSFITKADHKSITKKFFAYAKKILVPPEEGKKILQELTAARISKNKAIPYEFFCWERIFEDVVPSERPLEDILKEGLFKTNIGNHKEEVQKNECYLYNWFFKYSENTKNAMSELIDKILELNLTKEEDCQKLENLIIEYSGEEEFISNIKNRLLFYSYALRNAKKPGLANAYYSIRDSKVYLFAFINGILKKSVYEYFLYRRLQEKEKGVKSQNTAIFLNYIEKFWVN